MSARRAWLIGATSSLGEVLAHQLAASGWDLLLSGRNQDHLKTIAMDIVLRYDVNVEWMSLDLCAEPFDAAALVDAAGEIDACYLLAGDMDEAAAEDPTRLARLIHINFTAPAQVLGALAARMAERGANGLIGIVSSVAGDRGRASNYPYGSAKAGLSAFASGLRHRYAKTGPHVMTIKPGFVDTPMTWSMNSPLIASREMVARAILKAAGKQRNSIYVPWFWRYIMLIIIHIPERIFKRSSL